jgi:hypothetical protein
MMDAVPRGPTAASLNPSRDFRSRSSRIPLRKGAIPALTLIVCAGCASHEAVTFNARADQQAIVRDGTPALVSRRPNSLVLVRPASREFRGGARPVFTVAIYDLSSKPLEFRVANVDVTQMVNNEPRRLKVISYEELTQEERTRQVVAAIGTGLAAGANAMAASQAGYYNANSTVVGPRGTYNVQTSGYSPAAAAVAQANANAQNDAMISATIERGQANMATLEATVIKDNTLFPGEWYGGRLYIQPPVSSDGAKTYQIAINVGPDRHEIDLSQTRK